MAGGRPLRSVRKIFTQRADETPPGNQLDPGYDVDLYLSTTCRALTEARMGYSEISRLKDAGKFAFTGPKELETGFLASLKLGKFAKVERLVA